MPTAEEQTAIESHLGDLRFANIPEEFSGFFAAARDARTITGRDLVSGDLQPGANGDPGSWAGAVIYMILLDQIGTCFRPLNGHSTAANSIELALEDFAGLQKPERKAIYALRCAFAHDYSLINIQRNPLLQHHFIVSADATNPLVTLPLQHWNGAYSDRNQNNVTRVNLRKLGDTVELIIRRLLADFANRQLELRLQGGANELVNRYRMKISREPISDPSTP